MRKDSPLAQKPFIQPADLLDHPLICSRQSMTEEMQKWLGEMLDKLNIIATYDLLFNASVMVREGLGYALGFDNIIYTGQESPLCFRPLNPALQSPMYIIWKKYQVFTPVASVLLEEMKKQFSDTDLE